jgi:hypothetical protein
MAKRKGQMDKQHNGQKKMIEGQAIQWPKEKGQKDKKHNGQKKTTEGKATQWPKEIRQKVWPLCCLSFCPFLLVIVLLVLLSFSFGHCVACPSVLLFW